MAKLNQIIAIEKGIKSSVHSEVDAIDKIVQRADLFNGLNKVYTPKEEEGDTLPSESKRVQVVYRDVLRQVELQVSKLFDVTARKDYTNCVAKASVVIDDVVIVKDAPVSYLLFLEKNLTDMKTLVGRMSILDEADNWTYDEKSGIFKSAEIQTARTKKVQKPIVLYPHSENHPAQTQLITEDVIAGYWVQQKQSGAIPKTTKVSILNKIETLLNAVKQAREEANGTEEVSISLVGEKVFSYIFS